MAGITASGTKQRGQGVLVFRHNFSNEKLIAWFGRRKDVVALSGESFPVQSYAVNLGTALKDANSARKCFLAFPHEGVFVLAWDAESLGSAFTRAASENSPAVVQWPGLYAELGAPASSLLVAYADFSKMSATLESTGKVGLKRMREVAFQAEMKGEDLYARFFAQNATSAIAAEVAELLSAYRPALATHFPSLKVTLLEVMPEDHSRVHLNCSIPISDLLRSPRSR